MRGRFKPGAEVDLEEARCVVATATAASGGERCPSLIDLRGLRSQSAEARAFNSSPEGVTPSRAVALLVESPVSRVIGNVYLGFNRPTVPTRIFTDEASAKQWLREFKSPNAA